jgi:Holliday junction resolvasome RuvABC endonuclease subunit
MKILALDPATSCGWAHSDGFSGTWDLSVRRDESGGMRLIRLTSKLDEVDDTIGVDLVAFEAARHGAPNMQGALVVHAELQATIKLWCEKRGVDYRGYSPTEIKKFATGKGNAGKDLMLIAAEKSWPLKNFGTGDEVDAWWLLLLAMKELRISIDNIKNTFGGRDAEECKVKKLPVSQ